MKSKPILEIAGAGSGKTTRMIDKILECIPDLEPHRFLVVITYTNAATNEIKGRLSKRSKIPANVYIGTTLAFFNKFLLLPYATLIPKISKDKNKKSKEVYVAQDKIFFEPDDNKIKSILRVKDNKWQDKTPGEQKTAINIFINNLIKQGKIPFDKIASIASYLAGNKQVINIVGQRIQYLFIDEFQDANNTQFAVFDEMRKVKKTEIYKVGDAEQFIHNFRAGYKDFKKIPIIEHQSKYEVREEITNNRCSSQITSFINNFNTQLQQVARFSTIQRNTILFIDETSLEKIASVYKFKTEHWECDHNFERFYLAYENKTFDSIKTSLGLVKKSNDSKKPHSFISEVLQIFFAVTGMNQKQLCEQFKINIVQLRSLAVKFWKQNFADQNEFKSYFENQFNFTINHEIENIEKNWEKLNELKQKEQTTRSTEFHTSIHKSKGLEATCVLVVSKNNIELAHWLETDKNKRMNDKNDTKRLGFVAFSRAKMALCIACLEVLSDENRQKLLNLNVEIIKNLQ